MSESNSTIKTTGGAIYRKCDIAVVITKLPEENSKTSEARDTKGNTQEKSDNNDAA